MTNSNPRLLLRKHTYYIRVAIPRHIQYLAKRKEYRYSLDTKDYYAALSKLRAESFKIDLYIEFMKGLDMEIKGNRVLLTDTEIDQMLMYRLRVIEDFIENNYKKIRADKCHYEDIGLFTQQAVDKANKEEGYTTPDEMLTDPKSFEFRSYTYYKLFYDFLDWIGSRPNTKLSTKRIVDEIVEKKANFFQLKENEKNSQRQNQILNFVHTLNDIEEYSKTKIERLKNDERTGTNNPKVRHLLEAMRAQKNQEIANALTTHTKWEDVYEDMVRPAKHSKSTSASTLTQKKKCLETIFELLDVQYVEQINFDNIKTANTLIYRVPKKWKERNPNKRLLDVLLPDDIETTDPRIMSATNVCKYLTIFQEFLRFCRKERLLNEDMADIITKPIIDKNKNNWKPFTTQDLLLIFNRKTYYRRLNNVDNAKFWIPLISLYSGARLNEICQIRLEDIKNDNGIDYFCIDDEGEKQSVKNYPSKRRVPIHPVLIELGLMKQIERQRKLKKDRLFDSLVYTEKNKYAGSISNAFRYYLDKKIKITDSKKVFHSFRHTARSQFCALGVSEEDVNILCGWEGKGAGAKNYLHRDTLPIKKLYKSLAKLKYPELEKMLLE